MGLLDILQQYANPAASSSANAADQHFDEVARQAPPNVMGQGIADAFRSDQTPPFQQMVGHLFGQSDPNQKAGVVNQLLSALGPGVMSAIGGGMLGRVLGQSGAGTAQAAPQLTPDQASQLTPQQVQDLASKAQQHNPGVVDSIGGFYSEHPQLVRTLGSAALTIALASMANRMQR